MSVKKTTKNLIFIFGIIFIFGLLFLSAVDFVPQGDINLKGVYQIKNGTNITGEYFCTDSTCGTVNQFLVGDAYNASWNQSYADTLYISQTEEGNLNVNSSDYWDNLNTINSTQMENSEGKLNIVESWFTSLWNTIFGTKTTDDLVEGSNNLYDNQTKILEIDVYGVGATSCRIN